MDDLFISTFDFFLNPYYVSSYICCVLPILDTNSDKLLNPFEVSLKPLEVALSVGIVPAPCCLTLIN